MTKFYRWLKNKLEANDSYDSSDDKTTKNDDLQGWTDKNKLDDIKFSSGDAHTLDEKETEAGFENDIKSFLKSDPRKIAREITIWDWNTYKNLTIEDIKISSKREEPSKTVHEMFSHHDKIYIWTLDYILLMDDSKMRSKVINQFILINRALIINNNFHSAHAITSALNFYPIQRLSKTWKKLSKGAMKMFKNMTDLFSNTNDNFDELTERMRDAHSVNNISIPFLDLFLDDFNAAMILHSDVRMKTLERISIGVTDCRRLPSFTNDDELSSEYLSVPNYSIELMSFIQSESTKRSYCLQPPTRCYRVVSKEMDIKSMFDFIYE